MTTFESTITIQQPVDKIYDFLADMNNHRQLMPAEDISDWQSTYNNASFNLRGMVVLSLKIDGRVENKEVKILPAEKPPFEVELKWVLSSQGNGTEVTFTIAAELNFMMKMAVSGQLKKLAEHETNSLNFLFS